MSDFYVDLRPAGSFNVSQIISGLSFAPETRIFESTTHNLKLIVTRVDAPDLWAPYESVDKRYFIGIVGRIAIDAEEWELAKRIPGTGGLACKAIYARLARNSEQALASLNGNFTVVIHDRTAESILIITDRAGAAPAFSFRSDPHPLAISSHPDLLAAAVGESNKLDLTSAAEFIATGKLTPPSTYYQNIHHLTEGSFHKLLRTADGWRYDKHRYFELTYRPAKCSEEDLAERLAVAFRSSIRRRTHPLLGRTAVALSGGLDSRTILACCVQEGADVAAFTFHDRPNLESRTADTIARRLGVPLSTFSRGFDYYGETALEGLRISGGMGSFVNNHFLGFRRQILDVSATNLLTGFYCDYMFKGLAQNIRKNRFLRTERLAPFSIQSYRPHYWPATPLFNAARARIEAQYTSSDRDYNTDLGRLTSESKRVFPLSYEPDNVEATVPQRVLPWYLPTIDNEILDIYTTIPATLKPNASMYSKMVALICGELMRDIPDSNTGAPVTASLARQCVTFYRRKATELLQQRVASGIATAGSWPNWQYYVRHSELLKELWRDSPAELESLFEELLGYDPFQRKWEEWLGEEMELLLRLITFKGWYSSRILF